MKSIKSILQFLFFFFIFQVHSQELEINSNFLDADIHESFNIYIFNTDSNIVLSGDFFTRRHSSIHLEPKNGYSITIVPNLNRTSRVGIEEEDEDRFLLNRSQNIVALNPNPSNGKIQIISDTEIISISIFNSFGQKQTSLLLNNYVEIKNYKKGIYKILIYLKTGDMIVKSFIKN